MIQTYESFSELAYAMTDGNGLLHAYNCAQHRGVDPCTAWQYGVFAFAEWLDHIGATVTIPDNAPNFYQFQASSSSSREARHVSQMATPPAIASDQ